MYKKSTVFKLMLLLLVGIFAIQQQVQAQGADSLFNAFKKQMQKEFDDYQAKNEKMFNDFVDKNDKDFSDLLKKAWGDYNLILGIKPPSDPKPKVLPKVTPMEVKKNTTEEVKVSIPVENNIVVVTEPKTPIIQKTENKEFVKNSINFSFYGRNLSVTYDKAFTTKFATNFNQQVISDYWDKMIGTNHYSYINQLLDLKTLMNLNDWGYYRLVQSASAQVIPNSKNGANLLTWFVMVKSRYKVKVGFNSDNIYLLLPSPNMIYGKPYYTFGNTKYFILEENVSKIATYNKDYPDAQMSISFEMARPINVGTTIGERELKFKFDGKDYAFKVKYNKENMNFYNDYPLVDVKVYFDAGTSTINKESLVENLKPFVQGKSEEEAVGFILNFVQSAFPYATDDEQFKREKFFFAEETLFYPYCDCEDRSVLFDFLVKELVNLEVVGVGYPGHMAAAVCFSKDVGSDFFMYNNKKFTICDPTYIGAPVGMCMPQFVNVAGEVVPLENKESKSLLKQKIWDIAITAGGYRGGSYNDIVFDNKGNSYLTGYFNGKAKFGSVNLTSKDANNVFVAKFDKDANVVWAKQAASEANCSGNSISLDAANNVYVSGTFEQKMILEGTELKTDAMTDVFISKFDENGTLDWANNLQLDTAQSKNECIYVSRFDPTGAKKSMVQFNSTENFSNYGVSITKDGDLVLAIAVNPSEGSISMQNVNVTNAKFSFSHSEVWKSEHDRLVSENYERSIAGLFAFIKTMNVSGSSVNGKTAQEALDQYNPKFKKTYPTIYNNIGKMTLIKNTGGIINITTQDAADIQFGSLKLRNNSKLKIATFQGGNAQVNILAGAEMGSGKGIARFNLNFIKLMKITGDMVFDYDQDHSQKTMNLKRDILE
jgi:hypothetical protein